MYSNNLLQLFALGGASLVAASPVAVRNNDNGGDGSAEPCSLLNVTDDAREHHFIFIAVDWHSC